MGHKIVALTGAGISKASGIPTFEEAPHLRDLFTEANAKAGDLRFWGAYLELCATIQKAEPNAAHIALAKHDIPVITQNIDRLHTKAGSQNVIELHGRYDKFHCTVCGRAAKLPDSVYDVFCDYCYPDELYVTRPNIVLYGEQVPSIEAAASLIDNADTLLVVGTSLKVSPANLLVQYAESRHMRITIIDRKAEEMLPLWFTHNR